MWCLMILEYSFFARVSATVSSQLLLNYGHLIRLLSFIYLCIFYLFIFIFYRFNFCIAISSWCMLFNFFLPVIVIWNHRMLFLLFNLCQVMSFGGLNITVFTILIRHAIFRFAFSNYNKWDLQFHTFDLTQMEINLKFATDSTSGCWF